MTDMDHPQNQKRAKTDIHGKADLHAKRHWLVVVLVYAALLVGGAVIANQWKQLTGFSMDDLDPTTINVMIFIALLLFVLTSALPFVPGAEIGIGLMMLFGGTMALAVYLAMVAALLIAFGVGHLIPAHWMTRFFGFMGLARANALSRQMEARSRQERLNFLTDHAPARIVPLVLKHRYAMIAVALNVPGNSVLGGGGGIALIAGMSGLFRWPVFLLTVLVAVAPVPLFFFFSA